MDNENTIEIKVPNTRFIVIGNQKTDGKWDVFVIDPQTNYREQLRENASTRSFALFSSVTMRVPFPFEKVKYQSAEEKNAKQLTESMAKNAPLLEKVDKNPEIRELILNENMTAETAKLILDSKFYMTDLTIGLKQNKEMQDLIDKQGLELIEFRKFLTSIAALLDKLDNNPEIISAIMDDRFYIKKKNDK